VSGVPGASPVGRERARGTGHCIGARWTKFSFRGHGWNRFLVRRAQIALGDAFRGRGDALSLFYSQVCAELCIVPVRVSSGLREPGHEPITTINPHLMFQQVIRRLPRR
jgi:hypothetical protein